MIEYVSSRLPGGGTGGEVCRLLLYLLSTCDDSQVLVTELLTGCLVESANATPTAPQNRTAHCILVSETT